MTAQHTSPVARPTAHRATDGNVVDDTYLDEAVDRLGGIIAATEAAASRSGQHDVRALARVALGVLTAELVALSACLSERGRPLVATSPPVAAGAPALHGVALDRAFVAGLTAHAHASISAARIEMIAGSSRAVRPLAENVIHTQDRQLAALVVHARLRSGAQHAG